MKTKSFIYEVSEQLITEHGSNPEQLVIVVPAKRSVRFFTNAFVELFKAKGKASLLPRIITLSELIDEISPLTKISITEAAFHYFSVYKNIEKDADSFERFLKWAGIVLADFNEIDNYLIDARLFYADLSNIKEIEEWSFGAEEWSEGQTKFNSNWTQLYTHYLQLNAHLEQLGMAYNGALMRKIALQPQNYFKPDNKKHFVFAGFNALTACETKIIQFLIAQQCASVIFDLDEYYYQDGVQEAGYFLRKHTEDFGKNFQFKDATALRNDKKEVHFYECSGEVVQCLKLSEFLTKQSDLKNKNGAIVLCNEKLLPVLVNHLPGQMEGINVTMGWSLAYTSVYDFIASLIEYHHIIHRHKRFVPLKTARNLMNQTALLAPDFRCPEGIMQQTSFIAKTFEENGLGILVKEQSINEFIKNIVQFFKTCIASNHLNLFLNEILLHFESSFNKLTALPHFYNLVESWSLLRTLLLKFMSNNPISFVGEPFSGMQIMGMLETRGLDFDEVYILSANEGILPSQSKSNSIIPFDLKKFYHLPGKMEQDAVFAYYFYRLIQRAKKIHVFYNVQSESMGQAEKSRYLLQMEKELLIQNRNISFARHLVDTKIDALPEAVSIEKSDFYFNQVKAVFSRGVSASMIGTFVNCPMDFYYKYILGIRLDEEKEEFSQADIGNLVHAFFHTVFTPLVGKKIEKAHLQEMVNQLQEILNSEAIKLFPAKDFSSGSAHLGMEMCRAMIERFLSNAMKEMYNGLIIGQTVIGTELSLLNEIQTEGIAVAIRGNIDLILYDDERGYCVYDFKTGSVNENELSLKSVQQAVNTGFDSAGNKLMVQLLIYEHLISNHMKTDKVNSFIIPLAVGASKMHQLNAPDIERKKAFEKIITGFVNAIMSTEDAILHNEKSKYCELC